ncbi:hypothetical protein M1L60_02415 [Actinoplanes sp. TRM 88003]|uniref:Uncharacterized protein n=1 Tax=Paractinoplanes aksuensis TaxID=2939490 RepID=A0ABT1DHZ8_9ACTN|nr:hypothetical protein [Actinoplanes aksuensis]MCO8269441.1 hypothetical protein [Actinoplanes aksuensis]
MGVLWRDVLVPDHVVASDGLTAEVGSVVEMSLLLHCRYRTSWGQHEPSASLPRVSDAQADSRGGWVHDLVGRVVQLDGVVWTDGWVIEVDGLAVYVQEVGDSSGLRLGTLSSIRERGSDPPLPLPEAGAWVRVRGGFSVAEAYQTDLYGSADEVLGRAERRWLVRRIVRLDREQGGPGSVARTHRVDVPVMDFDSLRYGHECWTSGYLLDLEQPSDP